MTDVIIRPFEECDYPAAVAVGRAVFPDYPWSETEWRKEDAQYDGDRFVLSRLVAILPDGHLIGTGEYRHTPSTYHPQKFWTGIEVHPEFQGRGIGHRLYDALIEDLSARDPLVLWAGVRETAERGIRFASDRGFREVRRAWELRLDVVSFDPSPFAARASAAVGDMQIVSVAEEREKDHDWMQKVYDLHIEVDADVPRQDAYTPRSLKDYARHLFAHPDYVPAGHFLIKDHDRYVAETFLMRSQELPDILYQGVTGVRRVYRGQGLAVALKLRTIEYARRHEVREIRTWNDSLNGPMLAINRKLGFQPQPAWITFEKRLRE